MSLEFDVAVAGGGPAGAVTALCLARRGRRVALLEATAFDSDREGETLPPEINPVLRELALWDAFQATDPVESPGTVSVWGGAPAETDFVNNRWGPGWHIDRNRFDAMLCHEAVRAGAELFTSCPVRQWAREDGVWRLGRMRARMLVDASGRNGLGIERRNLEVSDRLLAAVLGLDRAATADLRTCIEATPRGWWYTSVLPQGKLIAMFFTDRAAQARAALAFDRIEEAPLTAARVTAGTVRGRRVVAVRSACAGRIFGDGWVLAGDAASSYDPLAGRGIFKALRHGAAVAEALDAGLRGAGDGLRDYAARVQREYRDYAAERQRYYAMERRWADEPFWRARRDGRRMSRPQQVLLL